MYLTVLPSYKTALTYGRHYHDIILSDIMELLVVEHTHTLVCSCDRWTRREEADFYRVVSTFGVVFDTQRQKFDWTQFRAFARLDKKTDESLEKYYFSFIAMCKRVCRMQVKTETGKSKCVLLEVTAWQNDVLSSLRMVQCLA